MADDKVAQAIANVAPPGAVRMRRIGPIKLATTGRPFNPDATPKDQFEKDAIVALKKGQARFERQEGGNLRVAMEDSGVVSATQMAPNFVEGERCFSAQEIHS